jgi:hypothetical protein
MACAYAPGSLLFYFASYIARHLVGISVGIGSNRRRKLLYIQMVMAVVEYRPGAPRFALSGFAWRATRKTHRSEVA